MIEKQALNVERSVEGSSQGNHSSLPVVHGVQSTIRRERAHTYCPSARWTFVRASAWRYSIGRPRNLFADLLCEIAHGRVGVEGGWAG